MDFSAPDARLLGRLLEATELRARVISANIANTNTPGYKRQVVAFEDLVRREMERHPAADPAAIAPRVLEDEVAPARPDGNNVTLELELNALRENRLLYEMYSAMLDAHFTLLDAAIREGR